VPSSPTNSHYNSIDNSEGICSDDETESVNYTKNDASNLTMFHVVFIIKPSDDKSFDNEIEKLYKNVILKLSHGLQHEQRYRSYVMQQTDLILSIKDESYDGLFKFIIIKIYLMIAKKKKKMKFFIIIKKKKKKKKKKK